MDNKYTGVIRWPYTAVRYGEKPILGVVFESKVSQLTDIGLPYVRFV